jgi:glutamine cyclotransferase
MKIIIYNIIFITYLFTNISCNGSNEKKDNFDLQNKQILKEEMQKSYQIEIIRRFPHDTTAFTQGLFYKNGYLYETTGQIGESNLRKVDLKTGEVLEKKDISYKYFGEGSTYFNGKIFYVTWTTKTGFVYDFETMKYERQFSYDSEGWGLTSNGKEIILSDGTQILRYKEPANFNTTKMIEVYYQGIPVKNLNELEWAKGEIYANIWGADNIAVIDESNGNVKAIIDCSMLREEVKYSRTAEVLNGIAYIPESDTFILTGKNWPLYFEVKIK